MKLTYSGFNNKSLERLLSFDKLKEQIFSKQNADDLAPILKDEMTKLIQSGVSPIKGSGRMPAYRGSYADRIKRNQIPGKKLRPVNLTLTGKFLKSLKAKTVKQGGLHFVQIGFYDEYGQTLEQGHREGHNNQAIRPVIPDQESESPAKTLQTIMIDFYTKVFKSLK